MNTNTNSSEYWLEQPVVFRLSAHRHVTMPNLPTTAKFLGAMLGSMLVLGSLGIGSQYHLPRLISLALYALVGWFFIKFLKVWTLSAQASPKSAFLHSLFNALGWSAVCFAGTMVANEEVVWLPALAVFAYVFTVILASDMLVWAVRRAWRFFVAKFH